jgi:leucyl aminopeptidase
MTHIPEINVTFTDKLTHMRHPVIQLAKEVTADSAMVLLMENEAEWKNQFPELHTMVGELFPDFPSASEEMDFVKLGKKWIFLIAPQRDAEKYRMLGHQIRKQLPKSVTDIALAGMAPASLHIAEGIALSNYQFLKYRSDAQEKAHKLASIQLISEHSVEELDRLNHVIDAVYWSRDLVNEPHSYLTASQLANEIADKLTPAGLHVTVLEKQQIEALKMGGLLAVNAGSVEPPTFTIIEHKPAHARNEKPIVLVGKGVVYDTGGLSLKPTEHSMDLMKSDMAGAACMAATMFALAKNNVAQHVIALIPATDNRPGGNAYAPGDVIRMYNGKTVEVLNTDAEGRMILADALSYGDKYDPMLVIDAATLTGSAVRAIGTRASVVMGNADEVLIKKLIEAGHTVHERLVEFPFWDEYGKDMESDIADLKNLGGPNAGMITAGKFLANFTKNPYIHLDIAGPAFLEAADGYRGKGGTGTGVRLLTTFLAQIEHGR